MKTLRVLAVKEPPYCVAVALDRFVVGQGANDSGALESLLRGINGHVELGDFDSIEPAPEKYQTLFSNSTRESKVIRGEYLIQMRSA